MKVVLDTNVLVSGLLTPYGPPGEIVRTVFAGKLSLCMDARILLEYEEVLHRPKFQFDSDNIDILIDFIKRNGHFFSAPPLRNPLPDSDDEPFIEVARAAGADALITGNLAHFPSDRREGVVVVSPSTFLDDYRNNLGHTGYPA